MKERRAGRAHSRLYFLSFSIVSSFSFWSEIFRVRFPFFIFSLPVVGESY